jgi:molybdopterin-guanine dinucleotide biosynthesis protein A
MNAGGRIEPLAAVYEPEAAELLERIVRSGGSAPRALAADPRAHTPLIPPDLAGAFRDIDTPEDLAAIG